MIARHQVGEAAIAGLRRSVWSNVHVRALSFEWTPQVSMQFRKLGRKDYNLWVASNEDMDQSKYRKDGDDGGVIRPWGFVSQSRVAEVVGPRHLSSKHTFMKTTPSLSSIDQEIWEEDFGTNEELCEGVRHAYTCLVDNFNTMDDKAPLVEEVLSPGLYDLYCEQLSAYHMKGLVPCVECNRKTVNVTLLSKWFELEGADRYDSYFGFDGREEDSESGGLLSRFCPKLFVPSCYRAVAAFCIESLESFHVKGGEIEHSVEEPMVHTTHYWVMERTVTFNFRPQVEYEETRNDMRKPFQTVKQVGPGADLIQEISSFTVRNINDAVVPREHEQCSLDNEWKKYKAGINEEMELFFNENEKI